MPEIDMFQLLPYLMGGLLIASGVLCVTLVAMCVLGVRRDAEQDRYVACATAQINELEAIPTPGEWDMAPSFPDAGDMGRSDGLGL
jgi:hypothetical protein